MANQGPIDVLLFDLDDTLIADEAAAEAAFLATCQRASDRHDVDAVGLARTVRERARELWRSSPTIEYCRSIGISSWEGLCARFDGYDPGLSALRAWAPTYRREAWAGALAIHGVEDNQLAEEMAVAFPEERLGHGGRFPEVEGMLSELRDEYRLGLVTNGAPDLQREKLRRSGLEGYFDAVVVSGEFGVGKPDPRILHHALGLLDSEPERAAMVGDSWERDMAGALAAGMAAVWIRRDRPLAEVDSVSVMQIKSLRELPALLAVEPIVPEGFTGG